MQVLLDTQVFVMAYLGDSLPKKLQTVLEHPDTDRILSTASLIEISIKTKLGKLDMTLKQTQQAAIDLRCTVIPFTPQHAYRLFALPFHHKDPFDRMIIATALTEQLTIASSDRQFKKYAGLHLLWT